MYSVVYFIAMTPLTYVYLECGEEHIVNIVNNILSRIHNNTMLCIFDIVHSVTLTSPTCIQRLISEKSNNVTSQSMKLYPEYRRPYYDLSVKFDLHTSYIELLNFQ